MSTGKLGSAYIANTANTVVYTVPSSRFTALNINMVNIGTVVSTVKLSISANTNPEPQDYVEYNVPINATGVIERTGIIAEAGEKVVVSIDTGTVTVRVHGIEEIV
jgi:hypothetical protein